MAHEHERATIRTGPTFECEGVEEVFAIVEADEVVLVVDFIYD